MGSRPGQWAWNLQPNINPVFPPNGLTYMLFPYHGAQDVSLQIGTQCIINYDQQNLFHHQLHVETLFIQVQLFCICFRLERPHVAGGVAMWHPDIPSLDPWHDYKDMQPSVMRCLHNSNICMACPYQNDLHGEIKFNTECEVLKEAAIPSPFAIQSRCRSNVNSIEYSSTHLTG